MCRAQWVLVLALYVGLAHSWDIAVSKGDQLEFYTNGIKTDTLHFESQNLSSLAYDEVHNMMLYVDKQSNNDAICGYYISSKQKKCFIQRNGRNIHSITYDPITEKLFFTDTNEKSINWISLKCGSTNNIYGNLLIKMDTRIPSDIAVDGLRGYIYWSNRNVTIKEEMERARFNGSEREALSYDLTMYHVLTLAIDPNTQKIYYFNNNGDIVFLNNADSNGKNYTVLKYMYPHIYSQSKELTITKDHIYWMSSSESNKTVWQLPKTNSKWGSVKPKEISKFYTDSSLGIVANYKLVDQIKEIQDCDSLSNLLQRITAAPGYTDQRCDVSVCDNYCLQGNCSFNDEGLPKCSCNPGFSGKRCEVYACHGYCLNNGECSFNENSEPVCQCKGGHAGDRCEVSVCLNYCMQGNCSVTDAGHPTCSCNSGYAGKRCEVYHGDCLNKGNCSCAVI